MKRVPWTVGTARTQSALHFLMAPLPLLAIWNGMGWLLFLSAPLMLIGLLPIVLVALLAWGLWNRSVWARLVAMVCHGVTAIIALSVSLSTLGVFVLYLIKSGRKTAAYPRPTCNLATFDISLVWYIGGIAFGVFILCGGLFWWFLRVHGPDRT